MLKRLKLRSYVLMFIGSLMLPLLILWGCSTQTTKQSNLPQNPETALATEIAQEIIQSCPVKASNDNNARNLCAEKLAQSNKLRNAMGEEVLWGGQKELKNYDLKASHLTTFDPFVWRRLYLSTFMFSGSPTVEQKEDLTIVHLPVQFRNQLDVGAFPYPFWHSNKKWESYHQAKEILLVMKDGKIKGAMRSADKDTERQVLKHKWDGQWSWTTSTQEQPQVTLYQYLLSESNPHVKKLDTAYRAFEGEMRQHSCNVCHSPNNANEMNPLLILNYPNQALTLRHETVRQIQEKLMPPPNGITDEQKRQKLVELAKAFANEGDKALTYENEQLAATTQKSSKHL